MLLQTVQHLHRHQLKFAQLLQVEIAPQNRLDLLVYRDLLLTEETEFQQQGTAAASALDGGEDLLPFAVHHIGPLAEELQYEQDGLEQLRLLGFEICFLDVLEHDGLQLLQLGLLLVQLVDDEVEVLLLGTLLVVLSEVQVPTFGFSRQL
jgi:hypothetical protein